MALPWPFSTRGARMSATADVKTMAPLDQRQFSKNDAVIRLWLTETLAQAIDLVSLETHSSRPDVLRAILFEHVYGGVALARLHQWQRKQEDVGGRVTREAEQTPYTTNRNADFETLGKANQEFKLHLPEIMRVDLEELSRVNSLTLGDYCRRALMANLFGVKRTAG